MAQKLQMVAFNRGLVDSRALARAADIPRVALSADVYTNFVPRVLGSMMLRPGLEYIGSTHSDSQAKFLPFVFSTNDTALLEFTDSLLRVWVDDVPITRPTVTAAVTNGTFDADIVGWTDNDELGGVSAWVTGGYMGLTGNGTNAAIRDQQVTVVETSVVHALSIVVERGPVLVRVGSSVGDDDYVTEATLLTGAHSLAFTPTGDFHVRLMSRINRLTLVDSCTVEAAGIMTVAAPWAEADLYKIRYDQSGDIVYLATRGYQQHEVQRRDNDSWSVVEYSTDDGPLRLINTTATTLTGSALDGNITLTASASFFRSTHVGSLFSLTSTGQQVTVDVTSGGADTFTTPIRVTGVDADRAFLTTITGTWTGTVTLQRSLVDETGPFTFVSGTSQTGNIEYTFDDGLDNQIVWYRYGMVAGAWSSGTAVCGLSISMGSITGMARATAFTSSTVVDAEVLTALGSTEATALWAEGAWSPLRGYPTAVAFEDGRLWWAGKNGVWGSVSDSFNSFEGDNVDDDGPISRTIGSGPVDTVNFLIGAAQLIIGAEGAEFEAQSTSFDEPLTPSNFHLHDYSTHGSAEVGAAKIDARAIWVQRGGLRVFESAPKDSGYGYVSSDLTALVPDIGKPGILAQASQRQPDTRDHFVRSDGTVAMLVHDDLEEVTCWLEVTTDGLIEDVVSLPAKDGEADDQTYYSVQRTINGVTKRYLEKWALEDDCRGETLSKNLDSFTTFVNAPASPTVTGLDHLEGESVSVWADGKCLDTADHDIATFVVVGGAITLLDDGLQFPASTGIVGLAYLAQWRSGKLLQLATQRGSSISSHRKIAKMGLILAYAHAKGLQYGRTFTELDDMPEIEEGAPVDEDEIRTAYEGDMFEFDGSWGTDERVCLQARAPRPVTVLATVIEAEGHG